MSSSYIYTIPLPFVCVNHVVVLTFTCAATYHDVSVLPKKERILMKGSHVPQRSAPYDALMRYWRDVRTLKGLGLPTIATVTGFHTSNLSRIERSVHHPTLDTLDRLSAVDAYGCPWWNPDDNRIFLRALAYHLHPVPAYAPRAAEWWPADMTAASAAATVIAQGTTWTHSVRWPALVALWPALDLPGWQPSREVHNAPPPAITRPIWLWGAWEVARELEHDTVGIEAWYKNIAGHDGTDLATAVLGAILAAVERWRTGPAQTEPSAMPTDSDFRAVAKIWTGLSVGQRRLVREMVEALVGAR